MSLYIVIYAGLLIGGTVGPLPYDMAECQRRIAEFNVKTAGSEMRFTCEWHAKRPQIAEALKDKP